MISYLNTDLDLISALPFNELADSLKSNGLFCLYYEKRDNGKWYGKWYATYETDEQYNLPEESIADMVDVLEKLQGITLPQWQNCETKEFNIGFECGNKPWAFKNELSPELVIRRAGIYGKS